MVEALVSATDGEFLLTDFEIPAGNSPSGSSLIRRFGLGPPLATVGFERGFLGFVDLVVIMAASGCGFSVSESDIGVVTRTAPRTFLGREEACACSFCCVIISLPGGLSAKHDTNHELWRFRK